MSKKRGEGSVIDHTVFLDFKFFKCPIAVFLVES